MALPGVDVLLEDEAIIASLPTATDTTLLISADANAPTALTLVDSAQAVRDGFASATTMIAETDTLFGEGASRVYLIKAESTIATSLAKVPADLGPMQVVAPSLVSAANIQAVAEWALATNRVYLANAADGAADSAVNTLADTVIAAVDARNAGLWADWAIIPGPGGTTRQVPWSLVVAGMISRSDRETGNPNLAAAGTNVLPRYAIGIDAERSDAARETATGHQVNTAKTVAGQIRNYGFRSLADLNELPQWWDLSGTRTFMDVRAHVRSSGENITFGQIDGIGTVENRANGIVSARCLQLQEIGALYKGEDDRGNPIAPFVVDTSRAVNPIAQIQQGKVKAKVGLRTSPYLEHLELTLTKMALAA